MYCTKCGAKLPDSSKFCPKCGDKIKNEKVEVEAPKKEKTAQSNKSKPTNLVQYNINELKPISPLRKAIFPIGLIGTILAGIALILSCVCWGTSEASSKLSNASRIVFGICSILSIILCGLLIAHTIVQGIKLRKGYIKKEIIQVCVNGVVGILLFIFFIMTITCVFDEINYGTLIDKQLVYFGWMFSLFIYCVAYVKIFASKRYVKVETNDKIKQVVAISSLIVALVAFFPLIFVIVGAANQTSSPTWFAGGYVVASFVIGVIGFVALATLTCIAPIILIGGEKQTSKIVKISIFGGLALIMFIVSSIMFKGSIDGATKWAESPVACMIVLAISWAIALTAAIAHLAGNKKELSGLIEKPTKIEDTKTENTKTVGTQKNISKKATQTLIEVAHTKGTKGLRTASFVVGLISLIMFGSCVLYYCSKGLIISMGMSMPQDSEQIFRIVSGISGIFTIIVCVLMLISAILQAVKIRKNTVQAEITQVIVTFVGAVAGIVCGILLISKAFSDDQFISNPSSYYQSIGLVFVLLLFNTTCGKVFGNKDFKDRSSNLLMLRSIGKTVGINGIISVIIGLFIMFVGPNQAYAGEVLYSGLVLNGILLMITILLVLAIPVAALNKWNDNKAKTPNITFFSVFAGISLIAAIIVIIFTSGSETPTPKIVENSVLGSVMCLCSSILSLAAGIAGLVKAKKYLLIKQDNVENKETKK